MILKKSFSGGGVSAFSIDDLSGYEGSIYVQDTQLTLTLTDTTWTGNVVCVNAAKGNNIIADLERFNNIGNAKLTLSGVACYLNTLNNNVSLTKDIQLINPTGGYAVVICLPVIWEKMLELNEKRGGKYLDGIFVDILKSLRVSSSIHAIELFNNLLKEIGIESSIIANEDLQILTISVNPVRLGNSPISFSDDDIRIIYERVDFTRA